ncbi:hypothetical protein L6452_34460 [Arctium lappa]|uniref:Uncharacterized protein n=1 Tax=Arctium lappa TaxID=4217 RepID=A0ACB8YHM5_ARCLA|nr:hypothetical protein L6452_34460 [Arctium lappa]
MVMVTVGTGVLLDWRCSIEVVRRRWWLLVTEDVDSGSRREGTGMARPRWLRWEQRGAERRSTAVMVVESPTAKAEGVVFGGGLRAAETRSPTTDGGGDGDGYRRQMAVVSGEEADDDGCWIERVMVVESIKGERGGG